MSPDLERLLEALYESEYGEPQDQPKWTQIFDQLAEEILARQKGLTKHALIVALRSRYFEFRRQKRKPPTMPPTA